MKLNSGGSGAPSGMVKVGELDGGLYGIMRRIIVCTVIRQKRDVRRLGGVCIV